MANGDGVEIGLRHRTGKTHYRFIFGHFGSW
jgi:hypothetical protein